MKNYYVKILIGLLFYSLLISKISLAQDAGVTQLLSPINLSCGSSNGVVEVIVYNYGSIAISNIPVQLSSTGASSFSLLDTLKKTIPIKSQDTLIFRSTINTFNGGTYSFKIYTILSGDTKHSNDTLGVTLKINATPNTPLAKNFTSCGGGLLTFKAPSTSSGSTTYWFTSPSSTVPISAGDSMTTYVSSTKTYYAQSLAGSLATSLTNTFASGSGNDGNMFDVNVLKTLTIDSFDISTYAAVKDTVFFYYKSGTYSGYQTNSSAWTYVGKVPINVSGATKFRTNFGKSISLNSGKVYGLYISCVAPSISVKSATLAETSSTDSSYNSDLAIRAGDALKTKFGGASSTFRFNGTIFYSVASCYSQLVPVTATVLTPVKNLAISRDKTSSGVLNAGTASAPDEVCVGDTLKYDLSQPSNFLNADYGTKWKLSFSLKSAKGIINSNYSVTYPSSSVMGIIAFAPKSGNADSVYILTGSATNFTTGCDSVFTRYIHVNQHAVAKFTSGNVCYGRALSITNSSTPTGKLSFVWDFGNGDTSHSGTPPYKYPAPGTYSLKLVASNAGCKDSVTQSETIYNAPYGSLFIKGVPFGGQFNSGIFIDPDNVCIGDTNVYQISPPKGMTNSDYGNKWEITSVTVLSPYNLASNDTTTKKPTGNRNAVLSFFPTKNADSTFIIRINLRTIPGNCDSLLIRYIHVWIKPVTDFSFTNACIGTPVLFKDLSKVAVSNVTSWIWDFGDGKSSTSQNPSHNYATPGLYKVTLTAATDAGCGTSVTKTVQQYPRAIVNFTPTLSCNGFASSFADGSTISSGSITSWIWNFGDGLKSNLENSTHTYSKSGPYNVKLITTSSFGCLDSLTKKVTILPKPVAQFTYRNACVGSKIFMSNSSIDSSNQSTYSWDFGDASTSTLTSPSHTYNSNGSYKINLKVISKTGCYDTVSELITPNPKPAPNFFFANGCKGQTSVFADSSHSDASSIYEWDFGDGASYTSKSNITTHAYKSAGSFNVSLVLTNGGGCIDSEKKTIVISDYPKAGFNAADVCIGKVSNFNNTSTGTGPLSYKWYFGDKSPIVSTTDPTHNYLSPGIYSVKLAAINANGCADTFGKIVNVNPLPVIPLWTYTQKGYKISFVPQDTTLGKYTWHFGDPNNDSSNAKSPEFTYPALVTKYAVELDIISPAGCRASRTDSISVAKSGIALVKNNLGEIKIYPNPFEGTTSINYKLIVASKINISVFDMQGRLLGIVKSGTFEAGDYADIFDANKFGGNSGVYLLKIALNDNYYVMRIVNLK